LQAINSLLGFQISIDSALVTWTMDTMMKNLDQYMGPRSSGKWKAFEVKIDGPGDLIEVSLSAFDNFKPQHYLTA
jgi:hypothetical protein